MSDNDKVKVKVSEEAAELIQAQADTSFDCGEWTGDYDESYDAVIERSTKAEAALTEYVARLERVQYVALEELRRLEKSDIIYPAAMRVVLTLMEQANITAKHAPDVVDHADLKPDLKQLAGDILTTSVEGGSGYWAEISHVAREKDLTPICATYTESEEQKTRIAPVQVTRPMIVQALRRIAAGEIEVGREYIANACLALIGKADGGDFDSTGADVVIQVAVFGTIVYG